MAKFRFSLEQVRHYKLNIEEQHKNELAIRLQRQKAAEEILVIIEKNVEDARSEMAACADVNLLLNYSAYLEALDNKALEQQQNINGHKEQVIDQREIVKKAMLERKIIDKFKDNKYLQFLKDEEKEFQKQMDDLAVIKYSHR